MAYTTKTAKERPAESDLSDQSDGAAARVPVEIEATVIDNAYIELVLDGKKFTLWEDEAHRLRKVMDRAAIELPR